MKSLTFSCTNLEQLKRQVDGWRQRQSTRTPLPDSLWDAAAALARVHGVSRVARLLRLDFHKLRRRLLPAGDGPPQRLPASAPAFIELKLDAPHSHSHSHSAPPSGLPVGAVELVDGPHRRMRLQTGFNPEAWIALAQSFWRREE